MTLLAALLSGVLLQAQAAPQGKVITPRDGDTVVLSNADRVRLVRRHEGVVRLVFDPDQRVLVALVDHTGPGGAPADGRVDFIFTMEDVQGAWPIDTRWEWAGTVDDYVTDGGPVAPGTIGLGLTTPSGLIQMFNSAPVPSHQNPAAIATLTFRGNGRAVAAGTFDEVEQRAMAQFRRSLEMRTNADGSPRFSTRTAMSATLQPGGAYPAPSAPIRVGGSVKEPKRIVDVAPVTPEIARQANVSGLVILEVIIDKEGAVESAKVLRSIPLLDEAALAAVKQWRYEPTHLNGMPVPVIMTVTVNFTPR